MEEHSQNQPKKTQACWLHQPNKAYLLIALHMFYRQKLHEMLGGTWLPLGETAWCLPWWHGWLGGKVCYQVRDMTSNWISEAWWYDSFIMLPAKFSDINSFNHRFIINNQYQWCKSEHTHIYAMVIHGNQLDSEKEHHVRLYRQRSGTLQLTWCLPQEW